MIKVSRIPEEWKETNGKNIRIGIIDSGCDINHKSLNVSEYKVFGKENLIHGTHIAGIISSNAMNYSHSGYCKDSEIIFAACDFVDSQSLIHLIEALEWMKEKNVDVLNLSFALKKNYEKIYNILFEMSKKTIICCSYSEKMPYPHKYNFVVSVGKKETDNADVVAPSKFISTFPDDNYSELTGSSMASAFVSSVMGIAKSYDCNLSKDSILNTISGNSLIVPEKNALPTTHKQIIFKR